MAITVHAPGILLLWWAMWTSPKLCWISGTATAMPSTARAGHLWVWHFRPVIRTNSGRLGCKCVVFPVTCCIQISKISRLNRSIQRHSYPLYPLSVRITATKATKSMKLTYAYICLHHPFWISSGFFSVSLDLSELFQHFEVSISSEFGNREFHNFTHWTHIGLNGVSILRIDFASISHRFGIKIHQSMPSMPSMRCQRHVRTTRSGAASRSCRCCASTAPRRPRPTPRAAAPAPSKTTRWDTEVTRRWHGGDTGWHAEICQILTILK